MRVREITPKGARMAGPASAMQRLGEVASATEVAGLCTVLVSSEADASSCFISLTVPEQITGTDAQRLRAEMPVYLMGEGDRPLRSESLNRTFDNLCGAVDAAGRLVLTRMRPADTTIKPS